MRVISLRLWLPLIVFAVFMLLFAALLIEEQTVYEEKVIQHHLQFVSFDMITLQREMEKELNVVDVVSSKHSSAAEAALLARGVKLEYTALAALDEQGRILYATKLAWKGKNADATLPFFDNNRFFQLLKNKIPDIQVSGDRNTITVFFPLTLTKQAGELRPLYTGALYLVYDLRYAKTEIWDDVWNLGKIMIPFFLLCIIILISFLNIAVTRPLKKLILLANDIAEGKLGVKSSIIGQGELAQRSKSPIVLRVPPLICLPSRFTKRRVVLNNSSLRTRQKMILIVR
ncbi:hypothetical protein MNBD_GAMMA16-1835 [hydrothermal vent metagenome]|uniref:HAMP domain-containing protein n=1 Tax=hydrothermal vent metagenome TaxID=652676 RepID=A0A3B0ZCD4_9ZZZZ